MGKDIHILTKKGVFAGTKGIAAYFVTEGWYLDEYGDLVNNVTPSGVTENTGSPVEVPQGVQDAYATPVEEPTI